MRRCCSCAVHRRWYKQIWILGQFTIGAQWTLVHCNCWSLIVIANGRFFKIRRNRMPITSSESFVDRTWWPKNFGASWEWVESVPHTKLFSVLWICVWIAMSAFRFGLQSTLSAETITNYHHWWGASKNGPTATGSPTNYCTNYSPIRMFALLCTAVLELRQRQTEPEKEKSPERAKEKANGK